MKGLLGAATVIGSLMYGAGHVLKGQTYTSICTMTPLRIPPLMLNLVSCLMGAIVFRLGLFRCWPESCFSYLQRDCLG